jgi:hypothetical protein
MLKDFEGYKYKYTTTYLLTVHRGTKFDSSSMLILRHKFTFCYLLWDIQQCVLPICTVRYETQSLKAM